MKSMKNRSEKHTVEDYDSIGSIRYGSDSSNRKQRSAEQKIHITYWTFGWRAPVLCPIDESRSIR